MTATLISKAKRVEVAIERLEVSAFVVLTDFPEADGTLGDVPRMLKFE